MLKSCKRMPFDLRRSLLPPTIAHRRPPNLPRRTAIASSKRISTNGGQKKAAVAAKALDSESIIPDSQSKGLPTWMQMQTESQAKSKMGQAVLKTLQVGLLEKLADVTMASGLDLACIAGTVAVSSATVFLISRLSVDGRILKVT
ncbi:hypothetical protein ACLOJK_008039 [Asimina triloba]